MRFFKYILTFALALLLLAFAVSCDSADSGNDSTDVTTTSSSEADVDESSAEDVKAEPPKYIIIYPQKCLFSVKTAALNLKNDMKDATKELSVTYKNDTYKESEYEILVGNTNRPESLNGKDGAGNAGWWVQTVGKKIVINAMTPDALEKAIDYFMKSYTVKDGVIEMAEEKNKVEKIDDTLIDRDITLRVGSYNIKNGAGVNHKMSVLAEDIKRHNLDVVCLQEVDIKTDRVNGLDTLKLLAEAAGYPYYYFSKAINYSNGQYGTAIMSRFPILKSETFTLPKKSGSENRSAGHIIIDVKGMQLHILNTHLCNESAELRAEQLTYLAEKTKEFGNFILTGDFNTTNAAKYSLIPNKVRVNNDKYATYPSSAKAIDEIMAYHYWSVADSGMDNCSGHSDHNLLWAELRYDGGMN